MRPSTFKVFLKNLMPLIDKYFEEQKEFIKCKMGCANCCSSGNFPTTELEFAYVREGFYKLPGLKQRDILKKSIAILKERQEFIKENDIKEFRYKCPLLGDDNVCPIYEHRPLICRIHGLILQNEKEDKPGFPYCVKQGLNYSDVCQEENKILPEDKLKELGYSTIPKAYNLGYDKLINLDSSIEFGDVRMFVEWLILDLPNADEIIQEIKNNAD